MRMVSELMKVMSFAEIVQGKEALVRVTADGMLFAVDLVMAVTGKNNSNANQVSGAGPAFFVVEFPV